MKFTNDLGSDNIKGLVWTLAVPSMLSQLVSVLYSIVDRMYIGNIPSNGTQALAGVGVCGPIVTLISSFAFLVGIGGAPLVSINLGEKNIDAAKKVIANCFVYILALAVPVTVLAYIFRRPILLTFGATEAVYPYAETYFSLYLIGTVFALTATGMNQFIITQGHSRSGMFSVLIGAIINIVLDPVFIFALHMGVAGAAIATVISQVASCAFVLCVLFGKHIEVPITFGGYDLKVIGRVTSIGMSAFLIILFDNVMLISLNMMLQRYGGDNSDMLLTCNTIVQSFELLITMPLGGITAGTQSILGYNYGAGNTKRIMQAFRGIILLCVVFCGLMFVLAQTVSGSFVRIFTRDPAYIEMASYMIRTYSLGVLGLAIQYPAVDGMTGMGLIRWGLTFSMLRKGLFLVCVFVLPPLFGATAVMFSEPISDITAAVVSACGLAYVLPRLLRRQQV